MKALINYIKSKFKYPTEEYPIGVFGFIYGPKRYENMSFISQYQNGPNIILNDQGFDVVGKHYFLSNLQKRSRFGFLIQKPFCFHIWIMFRQQKEDQYGNGIAESEFGYYIRVGLWRFDTPGTLVDGILRHWMGPWSSHAGVHFD
jgi:hypothetical protein